MQCRDQYQHTVDGSIGGIGGIGSIGRIGAVLLLERETRDGIVREVERERESIYVLMVPSVARILLLMREDVLLTDYI